MLAFAADGADQVDALMLHTNVLARSRFDQTGRRLSPEACRRRISAARFESAVEMHAGQRSVVRLQLGVMILNLVGRFGTICIEADK